MINIFRVFLSDVKRLSSNVVAIVIIMGLSIIILILSALVAILFAIIGFVALNGIERKDKWKW